MESQSHILAIKEDLVKVKEDIAKLALATKEDFAKLKEDVAKLDGKIDSKISESKSEMIKWMFIFWIGQIAATLLFLKK